ncbi:MAG: sulfite exporter TauE/SafE family protein [Ruminococcaceae bacterium]|nr:sulfite exporter TauE/SafE family protein [Oscillospiraceae bacterium]
MQHIISYSIMLILAVVTGCGIGSGGLFVVYLTLVLGVAQKTAQAENLVFFLLAASSSLIVQIKNRVKIQPSAVLLCSVSAIPGVILGTAIRGSLPENTLRAVFGALLVFTGLTVILKNLKKSKN